VETDAEAGPRYASDWNVIVAELQAMAEEALGSRSAKVKEILARADRSRAGIEAAINDVSQVALVFVDASRLQALAFAMRSRVAARIGLPAPTVSPQLEADAEAAPMHLSDWNVIVAELQKMADETLGNRSSTVRKILDSADRSHPGIDAAINDVSQVSLLFVDASRLQALASAMRTRVAQRTGSPPPVAGPGASLGQPASKPPPAPGEKLMDTIADNGGCLGNSAFLLLLSCLIATAVLIASALNITS
jgi:hypothetical protein